MSVDRLPRVEACYFVPPGDATFVRMARVLEATLATQCPAWPRRIEALSTPTRKSAIGAPLHAANVHKVAWWSARVHDAADGQELVLLDADVAVVRPLDDLWEGVFDLAYTTKRRPFPFNLGVLFVRVSDRTRAFFRTWLEENLQLLTHQSREATAWRRQFGGINQASFGRLLARGALADLALHTVPCREWNCEDSAWSTFDPAVTRILHVKGALRRAVFRRDGMNPDLARAAAWYQQQLQASRPLRRSA